MSQNPPRHASIPAFADTLECAAEVALGALATTAPYRDRLLSVLTHFEREVREVAVQPEPGQSKTVREAVQDFGAAYDERRHLFEGVAERTGEQLAQSYAALERDAQYVTVLLFGRTKAGKSTTLEALTGGDGATIGTGKQHTTRQAQAYYFPAPTTGGEPDAPCLRIVDTPGIEGFEGQALAEMAEGYIERADHILFLVSDDRASAEELARFDPIRTQGKNLTVLLNVKGRESDLDLLTEAPEEVFKPRELAGHQARIAGHLEARFGLKAPELLPFHAHAGWRARSGGKLPDGAPDHSALAKASGIEAVEARLQRFVLHEAIPARRRAPRDLLNSYLWGLKDELRPVAGAFRALQEKLGHLDERLAQGAERAHQRAAQRLPQLQGRFQAANEAIPAVVDGVISRRGSGRDLQHAWQELLRTHGVTESVAWFTSAAQQDFTRELEEQARVAAADFETSGVEDLGSALEGYHEQQDSAERQAYGRAGMRTGAGAVAGGLTYWAVANWWNPSGWIAGAAAGVAACGAQAAAQSATDEWARENKRDLARRREHIIKQLRERLWTDHAEVQAQCRDWLQRTEAAYRETVEGTIRPVRQAAGRVQRAATETLRSLDQIADELNRAYVQELLADLVPEVADGRVTVARFARQPGFTTKIRLVGADQVCPLGACIGPRGRRVKALREALGGERVELVDAAASLERQVYQALGMAHRTPALSEAAITIQQTAGVATATVRCAPEQAGRLIGASGANIRLARKLLGMTIHIQGGA